MKVSEIKIGEYVKARRDIIQHANHFSPDLLMARRGDKLVVLSIREPSRMPYPIEVVNVGRKGPFNVDPWEIESWNQECKSIS